MAYWSYIAFALALAAGLFGFGGDANMAAGVAQTLFFVFLAAAIVLVGLEVARDHDQEG